MSFNQLEKRSQSEEEKKSEKYSTVFFADFTKPKIEQPTVSEQATIQQTVATTIENSACE